MSASQQPPPKTPTQPERETPTNQSGAAPSVPATTNPPVSVNVKPSMVQHAPNHEEGNHGRGSDADWPMFWVTLAATLAGFGLLYLGWQQLQVQRREAEQALRASQETLILTHRPRIIVRNIDVIGLEMYSNSFQFAVPEKLEGRLMVTNSGFTVATIIRFHAEWLVTDRLPIANPVFDRKAIQMSQKIAPGGSHRIDLPEWKLDSFTDFASISGLADRPNHTLWLIGIVKYRDQLGNLRQTVFGRKLDRTVGRFIPVENADYEYAD